MAIFKKPEDSLVLQKTFVPKMLKDQLYRCRHSLKDNQKELFALLADEVINLKEKNQISWRYLGARGTIWFILLIIWRKCFLDVKKLNGRPSIMCSQKTILVTGGTGFLGSNLCERLIHDGQRVICVDNNYTGNLKNVASLQDNPNFRFVLHDIINPLEIDEKIDQIYNLACPASPRHYQGKAAVFTTKTCVLGALNMLELAKKHGATIFQSSTSEVYGEPAVHPQPESYRGNVNPIGIRACYDEGKRCAESLFFDYYREEGIDIKVVRIFNTYGPKMNPEDGRVVSNVVCQALRGEDITLYGDGTQTRSFCYVDDLIEAFVRMMATPKGFTGPVNTGNPGEFTVGELAQMVISKIGGNHKIVYKPLPKDDPTHRKPDITLAKQELGWEPQVKLSEGLDKTIAYFKQELKMK